MLNPPIPVVKNVIITLSLVKSQNKLQPIKCFLFKMQHKPSCCSFFGPQEEDRIGLLSFNYLGWIQVDWDTSF